MKKHRGKPFRFRPDPAKAAREIYDRLGSAGSWWLSTSREDFKAKHEERLKEPFAGGRLDADTRSL